MNDPTPYFVEVEIRLESKGAVVRSFVARVPLSEECISALQPVAAHIHGLMPNVAITAEAFAEEIHQATV